MSIPLDLRLAFSVFSVGALLLLTALLGAVVTLSKELASIAMAMAKLSEIMQQQSTSHGRMLEDWMERNGKVITASNQTVVTIQEQQHAHLLQCHHWQQQMTAFASRNVFESSSPN